VAFTVVYDACVLYPAPLRDLLLRVAITGLVRARWTDAILDECFRAIAKHRPRANPQALARTRELIVDAVPDCLVTDFAPLIEGLTLPDRDDRHVLAAAIRCGAQAIVTFNLKDFPDAVLQPLGVEAIDPDDYVSDLIDLSPAQVAKVLREQSAGLRNPFRTVQEVLGTLERQGLPQSVARLRELLE
jgi:hypothetical protein